MSNLLTTGRDILYVAVRERGGEIAVVCLELDLTHFPLPPPSVLSPSLPPFMHANKSGTAWTDGDGDCHCRLRLSVCLPAAVVRIYPIARTERERQGEQEGTIVNRPAARRGVITCGLLDD